MKQEHKSIEELLEIEKDLKKILDGGCYLEYFEGVTSNELLDKSYEIKVATNPLRELAEYVVNYKPHLNSRNLLERVNRVEVIDYTKDVEHGGGRAYVKWEDGIKVEQQLQDDNRTLKIFITQSKEGGSE